MDVIRSFIMILFFSIFRPLTWTPVSVLVWRVHIGGHWSCLDLQVLVAVPISAMKEGFGSFCGVSQFLIKLDILHGESVETFSLQSIICWFGRFYKIVHAMSLGWQQKLQVICFGLVRGLRNFGLAQSWSSLLNVTNVNPSKTWYGVY